MDTLDSNKIIIAERIEKESEEDEEKMRIITVFRKLSRLITIKGDITGSFKNEYSIRYKMYSLGSSSSMRSFKGNKAGCYIKLTVSRVKSIARLEKFKNAKGKVYMT